MKKPGTFRVCFSIRFVRGLQVQQVYERTHVKQVY